MRVCAPSTLKMAARFDVSNPRAVKAANAYSARSVTAVSRETKRAIAAAVQRGFKEGKAPKVIAREIREMVGLTRRQAAAVQNARAAWGAQGLAQDVIDARVSRYSAKLVRKRARLIAHTESIRAVNMGQLAAWDEAVSEGVLQESRTQRRWSATGHGEERRVCDVCADLDGTVAPLDGTFAGGILHPPAHPGCRCSTGLVFSEGRGR